MLPAGVLVEFARLRHFFIVLPETEGVFSAWERLVAAYQVSGKSAHDARLVAAMQLHGISSILRFDRSGFSRFAGIDLVHPTDIVSTAT